MLKTLVVFSLIFLVLFSSLTNSQFIIAEKARVSIVNGASDRQNFEYYSPERLEISEGTTVTWTNDDDSALLHTITSGNPESGHDGKFDSAFMAPGTTFRFTFEKSGNYDYFCVLHQFMRGEISVSPNSVSYDDRTSSSNNNNGINWKEICHTYDSFITEPCDTLVLKNNPNKLTKEGERVLGCFVAGGIAQIVPGLSELVDDLGPLVNCGDGKNKDITGDLLSGILER